MHTIDCAEALKNKFSYEDTYSLYLKVFRRVAVAHRPERVANCPVVWVPMIQYLGGIVESTKNVFPCDMLFEFSELLQRHRDATMLGLEREFVESMSTWRPELVDALWQSDVVWQTRRRPQPSDEMIVVTNNGSFHRQEIQRFQERLVAETLVTTAERERRVAANGIKGLILVPCAADKPYPAPLHRAVRDVCGPEYDLAVVTGVFGIVPEDLWPEMPLYDSGIPNRWRVIKYLSKFFEKNEYYRRIICYSDFYSEAIAHAHKVAKNSATLAKIEYPLEDAKIWVRGTEGSYLDLMNSHPLTVLERCISHE
jgi:predicted RNA-binding protein